MQGVTESLAGRAAILDFSPMSLREVYGLATARKNSRALLEESNMEPQSHEQRIPLTRNVDALPFGAF
jgi:predicted AAA+ superfamily ATPase